MAYVSQILENFLTILRKIFETLKVSLMSSFCEIIHGRVRQIANTDSSLRLLTFRGEKAIPA